MTIGQALIVVSKAVPVLQSSGIMDGNGNIVKTDATSISMAVSAFEREIAVFEPIPDRVQQIVAIVPIVLQIAGLK